MKVIQYMTACPRCGAVLATPAGVCPSCGMPAGPSVSPEPHARLALRAIARQLPPVALFRPGVHWREHQQIITTLAGVFFMLALVCDLVIIAGSIANFAGLWYGLLAALVPALGYSLLVLALDRYEREPWRAMLGAFAWGAVVATVVSLILDGLAGSLLTATYGERAGSLLAQGLSAPLIEESSKGLALLGLLVLFRDEFDGVLDGLVYGALIGLGFALTENVLYLGHAYASGGAAALGQLFLAREVFGGLGHALYTATIGAAVGWTRVQHGQGALRFVVPIGGWLLAVAQHFLWNSGAAYAALQATTASFTTIIAVETVVLVLPGVLILGLIAARARSTEAHILREQLATEVTTGALTTSEYDTIAHESLRKVALRAAFRRGGLRRWATQQEFFQAAAELALCKYHCDQRDGPTAPPFCQPEDVYRQRLARLREALDGGSKV
ncbi:MAG: PrsW family glutamic-type intramembrane protease [Thermomicrobiales bacterium]